MWREEIVRGGVEGSNEGKEGGQNKQRRTSLDRGGTMGSLDKAVLSFEMFSSPHHNQAFKHVSHHH